MLLILSYRYVLVYRTKCAHILHKTPLSHYFLSLFRRIIFVFSITNIYNVILEFIMFMTSLFVYVCVRISFFLYEFLYVIYVGK